MWPEPERERGLRRGTALLLEAVALMTAAERDGDYSVADRAAALLREALAVTPRDAPQWPHHLSVLGRVHRDQFLHLGRRAALQAAIDAHRESLAATPPGDPQRAFRLFNLGMVLGDRYELVDDVVALDESIRLFDEVVRAAPGLSSLPLPARLNLGQRLRDRWRRRGDPTDLDRAVEVLAPAAAAGDDPRVALTYALVIGERYTERRDPADLDAAIEANRAAVAVADALPKGLVDLARVGLAALLGERYEKGHAPADLDAAIGAYRAAVDAAAGPDPAELRRMLGNLLASRYESRRRPADLAEALRLLRAAVAATDEPVARSLRLRDLGYVLHRGRADLDGVHTLRESRDLLAEAERLLPAGHPERPPLLNNLGEAQRELADAAGEPELLEPAVATLRAAVAASDADAPLLPRALSNLGVALQALFARTQDLATLTESIAVLRRALAAAPPGHPDRLLVLTNYGGAVNRRVELAIEGTADATPETEGPDRHRPPPAELERDARTAVTLLREAAELARHEADEEWTPVAHTLALALLLRHRLTGDMADVDDAVRLLRDVRAAMPPSTPDGHRLLTNLGSALRLRFQAGRSGDDTAELLSACRSAVASLPAGHPDRAMCLINLAGAVETVADVSPRGGDPAAAGSARSAADRGPVAPPRADVPAVDLVEAAAALREAAMIESAPSLQRAHAAERWAAHAARVGDLVSALDGYALAIELIDLVAWHGMDPDDQGRLLRRFPRLAGDAAAVAIALGRPERAVELLEYGRAVLLTRAHDAGADLAALRARAPRLADRLAHLQAELDGLARAAPRTGVAGGPERRHELASRRREVLAEIRRLPGFDGFLRPPPFADLAEAAAGGPVVLVNVAQRRCDALVVTAAGVDVVPLPGLTDAELTPRTAAFLTSVAEAGATAAPGPEPGSIDDPSGGPAKASAAELERRRAAARRRLTETLDWLWRVVAAPVLDALGPAAAPSEGPGRSRLWWCPTGLLTLLPLHAAAPLDGRDGVLDRVVPSYTASLRALRRARDTTPVGAAVTSALVVGMPRTPGLADLPGVTREEDAVRRYVPHVTSLTGPAATAQAVLAALPRQPVVHLCCHGTQRLDAPTEGRLVLSGGPLQVRDLWRPAGTAAALAVLSACETVRGGAALADEALTLGTAFQLAGFRHVIGALWSISDALTAQLSEELYAGLAVPGGIDPERAASALHRAVRRLRAALPGLPDLWAGYAHIGP
ncbi:CHAT domain-containing protein [Micromonospora sp. 15K316]|uniref:CHAT domain-containing protein n=1 Tax=Micromonospora sp. 15K316 TaxID=2530376 RepID=UPI001045241C|nr:CHAT domain-containing protein [Micromonospora sp. 15K316]TDC28599.1 CHAT domain-containing protein [Micromonospora sp. 15K316]